MQSRCCVKARDRQIAGAVSLLVLVGVALAADFAYCNHW
jgi:hypothetical protein